MCEGSANETFKQCPIGLDKNKDKNEFLVIAHNSAS